MKNTRLTFLLFAAATIVLMTGCSSTTPAEPTSTLTPIVVRTTEPTATPTPPAASLPTIPLFGYLEIRFPDPFGQPEFCSADIPYQLTLSGDTYLLTGEGNFYCHNIMTYEQGFKQHLEQDYDVFLDGSMPNQLDSILEVNLRMSGAQDGYFSDLPPKVPETLTSTNPFHVEIDQPLLLKFAYQEEAYCLWNTKGVFTALPGEEPPTGEDGWLFILYPGK